jgi:hypothetical protein
MQLELTPATGRSGTSLPKLDPADGRFSYASRRPWGLIDLRADISLGLREVFTVDLRGSSLYLQLAHNLLPAALGGPHLT